MTHIPKRMCIACRGMFPKNQLMKFVYEENSVVWDKIQKKFGRGAYICKNEECIIKAKKRHALSAKFKTNVPDSVYPDIEEVLNG